jgi:hypothetical protein
MRPVPASEGVTYIPPTLPGEAFREAFRAVFNQEPDVPSAQAYDAVIDAGRGAARERRRPRQRQALCSAASGVLKAPRA